jgi:hypothetical protein
MWRHVGKPTCLCGGVSDRRRLGMSTCVREDVWWRPRGDVRIGGCVVETTCGRVDMWLNTCADRYLVSTCWLEDLLTYLQVVMSPCPYVAMSSRRVFDVWLCGAAEKVPVSSLPQVGKLTTRKDGPWMCGGLVNQT